MALVHLDSEVGITAQLGNIDPREIPVQLSLPLLPMAMAGGQQRLAEQAPQAESLAPRYRWRGVQAQRVAARAIAHHEVHLFQRKRRGTAHLVGPTDRAVADHEFRLAEKPIGGTALVVATAREVQAADEELAVPGAVD